MENIPQVMPEIQKETENGKRSVGRNKKVLHQR